MTEYRGVVVCDCVKEWLARIPRASVTAGVIPRGLAVSAGYHEKRGTHDGPDKKRGGHGAQ